MEYHAPLKINIQHNKEENKRLCVREWGNKKTTQGLRRDDEGKEGCALSQQQLQDMRSYILLSPGEGMQKMQRAAPAQVDFLLSSLSAVPQHLMSFKINTRTRNTKGGDHYTRRAYAAHKKTRQSIKERKNNGSGRIQRRERRREMIIMCCGVFGRKKRDCAVFRWKMFVSYV